MFRSRVCGAVGMKTFVFNCSVTPLNNKFARCTVSVECLSCIHRFSLGAVDFVKRIPGLGSNSPQIAIGDNANNRLHQGHEPTIVGSDIEDPSG